jgi:hypothetical protein
MVANQKTDRYTEDGSQSRHRYPEEGSQSSHRLVSRGCLLIKAQTGIQGWLLIKAQTSIQRMVDSQGTDRYPENGC